MPMSSCILIYGRSPDLLLTRGLVLKSAGFEVKTAIDAPAAVQALLDESVELALLCHTLSIEECLAMLTAVHSSRPETKVLMMSIDGIGRTRTKTEHVVSVFDGPGKLVAKVREIIGERVPAF